MTAIIITGLFSIVIVLLLASSATKVFSTYFRPTDDLEHWWEDDPEENDTPLQHPTNFTDYR